MVQAEGEWRCEHCGLVVPIGKDGVIELHGVKI
jgi:hypothetical protein